MNPDKTKMSGVKIKDLEDDGSDDDQTKRMSASSPLDPEDITIETPSFSDAQVARFQSLNQNAVVPYTETVRQGEIKMYNVTDSANAVVADTVIINQKAPTQLDKIKAQTRRKLDTFKMDSYYETRATMSAKECLKWGWVLLKGSEKCGKTSLGLYILKTFNRSYIPLYIQNQSDLECITDLHGPECAKKDGKSEMFVIFIDVPFKRHDNVDSHLIDAVELGRNGTDHVIVSISTKHSTRLQKSTLHKYQGKESQYAVSLQDPSLQEHERYEILKRKLKLPKIKSLGPTEGAQEAVLQEIARSTDHPWFFMAIESCGSKKGRELVTSLKNPIDSLIQQLEHMAENDQMKFAALVIIVKDGFLSEARNGPPRSPKSPQPIFEDLNDLLDIKGISLWKIQEAARAMVGEYLICSNKRYTVIHESVTDAVCQVLFSKSEQHMLEWCPFNYLIQKTVIPDCEEEDTGKLIIDGYFEDQLIKRLLEEESIMNALKFSGFNSPDFVKNIWERLKEKTIDYKDVLLQAISLKQYPLLKEIVVNVLRTLPGSGGYIKHLALEGACEAGNKEAYDLLISGGAKVNHPCMAACAVGKCPQIINKVLKELVNQFYELTPDKLKEWILIVITHGDIAAIKTFITNLQGRKDRPDLIINALEVACKLGSLDKYHAISCDGLSPNWTSLLLSASEGGNETIISELLEQRDYATSDEDPCNTDLEEMFLAACRFNRKVAAELLLKRNHSVLEGVTDTGQTALHLAASVSHIDKPDTLTWLLTVRTWDTTTEEIDGFTALHSACFTGNVACVEQLLKAGFDAQALDKHGNTPLHVHLKGKFINKPVVEKLVRARSAIPRNSHIASVQNNDKQSPTHLLCMNSNGIMASILQFLMQDEDEYKKIMKTDSHSMTMKDRNGQTPLHTLISSTATTEVLRLLLENKNVDVKTTDAEGNTVLHLACRTGNDEVIKLLMSKTFRSFTYHETNKQEQTPLHCYAENGCDEKITELLCKDVDAKDFQGETALHCAVSKENKSDVVKALMKSGANLNSTDNKGQTPLHKVASVSHGTSLEVAHMLVQELRNKTQRADVSIADNEQMTALHHACVSRGMCSSQVAEFLLSSNGDIWSQNVHTHLPIHICCIECSSYSPKVLKVLLKHLQTRFDSRGVQQMLCAGDKYGDTPLHKVCLSQGGCRKEVAEILIDAGADLAQVNSAGDTVMDIVRRNQVNELNELMIMKALMRACKQGIKVQELEKLLSCDHINSDDLSLMLQRLVQHDEQHTITVLEKLVQKGADIHRTTADGLTVIHLAATAQGEFTDRIIGFLISNGADLCARDKEGEVALHKVAEGKTAHCAGLIGFLHSSGIPIDAKDSKENTALHKLFSAMPKLSEHYRTCMEVLIKLKCPVHSPNKQGNTACALAKKHGKTVMEELLHTYCTKLDILDSNALKDIIANGADINSTDINGNTVLHKICTRRVSFVCNNVNVLLKREADKFLKNSEGKLAFDLACDTGLDEDVRELTVTERPSPEDLETDGASAATTPTFPLPRPRWVRRSPSEDWVYELRSGMTGIRNAAGMDHMDDEMEMFERNARRKLNNHFKQHL